MYSVLLCGQIPSLPVVSLFFLRPLLISSSFNEQLILLHLASIIVLFFSFLNKVLYQYSRHENTTCERQHTFIINVLFNR